jgi:hypothetical protein
LKERFGAADDDWGCCHSVMMLFGMGEHVTDVFKDQKIVSTEKSDEPR